VRSVDRRHLARVLSVRLRRIRGRSSRRATEALCGTRVPISLARDPTKYIVDCSHRKEVAKGGAGGANWGNNKEEAALEELAAGDAAKEAEAAKADNAGQPALVSASTADAAGAGGASSASSAPAAPVVKTYEEYLKEKASQKVTMVEAPKKRAANDGNAANPDWASKKLDKDSEPEIVHLGAASSAAASGAAAGGASGAAAKKKNAKKKAPKPKKELLETNFRIVDPVLPSGDGERGGRGGRGG
jgi:hypothetical protein